MVCRSPEAAAKVTGAAEGTAAVPAEPAVTGLAAGVCVTTGAVVSGVVQPAASARMITARRLAAITGNLFCVPLMVFNHPWDGTIYTDSRHKLYNYIYTIDSY
jgi:hypothetical protein